ncbi:PaaX family transcriptional regulator [Conexibacter woesei]|uniref:Transcriptional regulator, PaaX family n=1 Tax=Conexibacter woesei (strain DSM 14684 / CCUG 47730 / CIP 108061 / JCM 11494 / NBRC 100937 / ID131577) TaxID=469383 RepID=D3F5A8_CONWI|nr:PaaX family transcriptional regulator C-terminal domain-containing protein [Conexibacter woesei]ADB50575.1 transcriptional regulator, PaaX family [Conexibacter woesei DSM 14684]
MAAVAKRADASAAEALAGQSFQPQELVMTLLGSYVRSRHETVWSGGLVALLEEMGFSTGASRVALTRLVRRDLIARERSGRLIHYRITERADQVLAEGDRRIFSLGRADTLAGGWTMLWHDIPEAQRLERGRLARRLRFLGFGTLQDGLWISPHDREQEVVPLLEELGVAERAGVLVGDVAAMPGTAALVRRAWDLDALCERYRAFAVQFAPHARRRGAPRVDDREAFLVRTRIVHLFRGFPFLDPDLPDELMPDPRARRRAVDVFDAAYERLAEPAQRHFDAVTSGWQ